ncbi:kielin/chordin-like protein [Mytilus californianus]|uniref:kielin/chordin-like protein n=1 Tax=Mytilus californianus TaxID=6549 RepID=UPI00224817DA|nr:kielin/chordin-like protein [Mytilus californianus]
MMNFLLLSVLILPLVDCVDPLPSISVVSGCSKDGKLYKEGESFQPTPCEHCFCNGGKVLCAITDCFMPMCVDAVRDPTKCCSVCPHGRNCYAGNTIIQAGKSVEINDHTTCSCPTRFGFGMTALRAVCATRVDSVTVKVRSLTVDQIQLIRLYVLHNYITSEPIENMLNFLSFSVLILPLVYAVDPLPSISVVSGCSKDGKLYKEGASFQPTPCEHCFCNGGKVICAIADCFMPMCVDAVHDPTKCCSVCPNGRNCYAGNTVIQGDKPVEINDHTTCHCPTRFGFGMTALRAVCVIKVNSVTTKVVKVVN